LTTPTIDGCSISMPTTSCAKATQHRTPSTRISGVMPCSTHTTGCSRCAMASGKCADTTEVSRHRAARHHICRRCTSRRCDYRRRCCRARHDLRQSRHVLDGLSDRRAVTDGELRAYRVERIHRVVDRKPLECAEPGGASHRLGGASRQAERAEPCTVGC